MAHLIEKIREEIDRGVNNVSARSREVVESGRIRARIGSIRKQKQAGLEELGSIVYTMALRGEMADERIRAKCEFLETLDARIRENEDELRRLHARTRETLGLPPSAGTCECGAKLFEGSKYCSTCGRKIDVPSASSDRAPVSERKCPSCGANIPLGGTFCPECGAKGESKAA